MNGAGICRSQIIINRFGYAVIVDVGMKLNCLRLGSVENLRCRRSVSRKPNIVSQDFCRNDGLLLYYIESTR